MESGTRLGPYEIVEQLGAGGMGEVYLAEDTRLGRNVAIKVLPEEYAGDPERLARFEQEARAAAALNHPNIAAVHDVGESHGTHFIVQEYLEGQSLRDLLRENPPKLERALQIGADVAAALATAHKAGIVHRDIKPENVFVTATGHTKVLDFGLAKLVETGGLSSVPDATMSPTAMGTVAGVVMGTVGYMAPEQIEGGEIDGRADIFALGCVLYEMAGGRRPFEGKNIHTTLGKIVEEDPEPILSLRPELPAPVEWILEKCLAKAPERRYQHADDLGVDLSRAQAAKPGDAAAAGGARAGSPSLRSPAVAAIAVAALLVGAAIGGAFRGGTTTPTSAPLHVGLDLGVQPESLGGPAIAISSDGSQLAYTSPEGVFVRPLDSDTTIRVADSQADSLVFDATGTNIHYVVRGALYTVATTGGDAVRGPRVIEEGGAESFRGLSVGADGSLLVVRGWRHGIERIRPDGEPEPLVPAAEGESLRWPAPVPGHDAVVFVSRDELRGWQSGTIEIADLANDGSRRVLHEGGTFPQISPAGWLLYVAPGGLYGRRIDPATLDVVGPPEIIVPGVAWNDTTGAGQFSLSAGGQLIALRGVADVGDSDNVHLFDRDGTIVRSFNMPGILLSPDFDSGSGDLAFVLQAPGRDAVWVHDVARNLNTVAFDGGPGLAAYVPRWIAAGREILVTQYEEASTGGMNRTLAVRADGTGNQVRAEWDRGTTVMRSIAGDRLLLARGTLAEGDDLYVASAGDLSDLDPLVVLPGDQGFPDVSPDGRWLVYCEIVGGDYTVYVQDFTDPGALRRLLAPGCQPFFADSGDRLYWRSAEGAMVADFADGELGSTSLFFRLPGSPGGQLPYHWGDFAIRRDESLFAILDHDAIHPSSGRPVYISDFFDRLDRLAGR